MFGAHRRNKGDEKCPGACKSNALRMRGFIVVHRRGIRVELIWSLLMIVQEISFDLR